MPRPPEPSEKIESLERRLAAEPDSLLFVSLGEAYRRAFRLEDAERVLRDGLERHPGHHSARTALARVLILLDRAPEATGQLRRVLEEVPDNLLAQRLLDEVAGPSFEPGPAQTLPLGARRPEYPAASNAEVEQPQADSPPVTPETAGGEDDLPTDELSTETLAELYLRQGDRDRAIRIYRHLLARAPSQASWRARLADLEDEAYPTVVPVASPEAAVEVTPRGKHARLTALERYLAQVQTMRRNDAG